MKITRKKMAIWSAIIIVGGFFAIQLIPVWLAQNNPPVVAEPNWDSPETRALAKRACFDCHSNETIWPWYSKIAPISWLTTLDTVRGRSHLNFSEWGVASTSREGQGAPREMSQAIQGGEMPPLIYLVTHPNAKLTDAEKQQLIDGLQATLNNTP